MTNYFTTAKASEYLTNEKGLPISKNSLQHYKHKGNGPEFLTFGKRIVYTSDALDKWAESRVKPANAETMPLYAY